MLSFKGNTTLNCTYKLKRTSTQLKLSILNNIKTFIKTSILMKYLNKVTRGVYPLNKL